MKRPPLPVLAPSALAPRLLVAATLPLLLGSCTLGAYFSPITPFERATNGLYEGEGNGVTGRVPYRLTLTVQQAAGKASGVLQNLESKKNYSGNGTIRMAADGVALDMNFYENGNRYRAALHGTLKDGHIYGQLHTVFLGKQVFPYNVNLARVADAPTP